MPDYIPSSDESFDVWQANFMTYMTAHLADLGLTPMDADVVALGTAQTAWDADFTALATAKAAAEAARVGKDLSRSGYETIIRRLARRLQASTSVSDEEKAALGITVPDTEPTLAPTPTTKPVLSADTSQRFQITVSFADEGTPTKKAKPPGVMACELWIKVGGAAPVGISECEYLAVDTRTPYLIVFEDADAGKMVHLIGRWVGTTGEKGPVSETLSATVTG
jgi:hypothetical protein